MTELLHKLPLKQRKGSKPRCHFLTHGTPEVVSERLTKLVGLDGVVVNATGKWMPRGFDDLEEARLGTEGKSPIADKERRRALRDWWLAVKSDYANTPNWDIASTCTIHGAPGLLLVEAKAHDAELRNEEKGKPLGAEDGRGISINSRRNHVRIGACITEASLALSKQTGLPWALSRDWNYQMANRFAWSWKLTELGLSVVLVYVGFLGAEEMRKTSRTGVGQNPFSTADEWQMFVESHSRILFSKQIWNRAWKVHGQTFMPMIRTFDQPWRTVP